MRLDVPEPYERPEVRSLLTQLRMELDGFLEGMKSAEDEPLRLRRDVRSVLFLGVGGSGIVGDLVSDITAKRRGLPILCHRDYSIPPYSRKDSLVVAVSYSGNTAETLSAMAEAYEANLPIFAITSGGLMKNVCKKLGIPMAEVKAGLLPRMAVPHMLGAALSALVNAGLVNITQEELKGAVEEAKRVQESVEVYVPSESNVAKRTANSIYDKVVFIYSHGCLSSVGYRLKCQLNENSKILAVSQCLPEALHNDIEGWDPAMVNCLSVVTLRCKGEHPAVEEAMDRMESMLAGRFGVKVSKIVIQGSDDIANILSAMVICDYVSLYAAILRGVDPISVERIRSMREGIRCNARLLQQVVEKFKVEFKSTAHG
ncbi:MAG: bifunctional phosphoglucose/phosphomannose isomerase [Candidatus Terraquivivens tikiterensis]|uniref:Bifunctional phosphoglucose/phosphomannose isomerase n=1 Tax=Candidatus Terraquivivens tikiterensis TaxID=1980982 RepID=A0A2R7Y9A2_9ARCH|nr:MAG: bifunctional phosphoglucose/phosphomannose isomerase [Candidatus Terraquivivens tikiterensis]